MQKIELLKLTNDELAQLTGLSAYEIKSCLHKKYDMYIEYGTVSMIVNEIFQAAIDRKKKFLNATNETNKRKNNCDRCDDSVPYGSPSHINNR